jgi:hypothetical protein
MKNLCGTLQSSNRQAKVRGPAFRDAYLPPTHALKLEYTPEGERPESLPKLVKVGGKPVDVALNDDPREGVPLPSVE